MDVGFTQICVGVVMVAIVCAVTWFINVMKDPNSAYLNDYDPSFIIAWLISSIGFGVCLTVILYQNGIL